MLDGWDLVFANNILKNNHELFVIANKNRKPIDRIVKEGAKEVKSYEELCKSGLDALFLCVTKFSYCSVGNWMGFGIAKK